MTNIIENKKISTQKIEQGGFDKLLEICSLLEKEKDIEKFKKVLPLFLQKIEIIGNSKLREDIDNAYKKMQDQDLLLRVENISRVVESIANNSPYSVGDKTDHYANSVIPNNEGIRIAFAEGKAPGPVRLMIGFDLKSAIAFKKESVSIHEIDDLEDDPRDVNLRKAVCRHVEGEINPEHIKYVVLRIPRKIFPAEYMTPSETLSQSMYLFRYIAR